MSLRILRLRASLASLPLFAIAFTFASPARADTACFPACRSGYLCSAHGTCVSRCNPPCGQGEKCLANGECELSLASSSAASPQAAPAEEEESLTRLSLHGGALFQSSNSNSAAGFLTAFQLQIGRQHAAILGARLGVVFFEKTTTPEVGLDLGYRARFGSGDLRGGPLVMLQPQLWFGGDTGIHLGGAVGGFIEYKHLVIQIPAGAGAARSFRGYGSSSQWVGVFSVSATVGVTF